MERLALIDELRAQITKLQGRPTASSIPTHEALANRLQLQPGHAYCVDSATLAMLLMAGPSQNGSWCAVIGTESFGFEAAQSLGVDLSRVVLVPDPGDQPINVIGALLDVVGVIVIADQVRLRISDHDASRIQSRLQRHQAVLIAWGMAWPRAQAHLRLTQVQWLGIGQGEGHLQARQATIEVRRAGKLSTTERLWLPDATAAVRPVDGAVVRNHPAVVVDPASPARLSLQGTG